VEYRVEINGEVGLGDLNEGTHYLPTSRCANVPPCLEEELYLL
jgi:hypothetical protein